MNLKIAEDYLNTSIAKPLKSGKSGAQVYDIQGKYVLKCIQKQALQKDELYKAYQKEAVWYEYAANSGLHCLPEILEVKNTDEEIKILMRAYRPLSREKMDNGLLEKIMEVLATIHTAEVPAFLKQDWHPAQPLTEKQIKEAVRGWKSVLREHPEVFGEHDEGAVDEIAAKINDIIRWHDSEEAVLNHGDFHWDNLLTNEQGDIIICDWQGVSIGQASGELSFFFSRLRGEGIRLDEQEVFGYYAGAIKQLSGKTVTWEETEGHIRAANVITSFVFWHQYLHNCSEKSVQEIYGKMVEGVI